MQSFCGGWLAGGAYGWRGIRQGSGFSGWLFGWCFRGWCFGLRFCARGSIDGLRCAGLYCHGAVWQGAGHQAYQAIKGEIPASAGVASRELGFQNDLYLAAGLHDLVCGNRQAVVVCVPMTRTMTITSLSPAPGSSGSTCMPDCRWSAYLFTQHLAAGQQDRREGLCLPLSASRGGQLSAKE